MKTQTTGHLHVTPNDRSPTVTLAQLVSAKRHCMVLDNILVTCEFRRSKDAAPVGCGENNLLLLVLQVKI